MLIRRKARTHERPASRRGGWRRGLVALAAVLPVVSVLAVTAPASAHANAVTGVASCQADGTYTITWTITNDYSTPEIKVEATGSTGGGTLTGLPTTIAAGSGSTATAQQTGVPGTTKSASLTVKGTWQDPDRQFTNTNSGSVRLDGKCAPNHKPITLCHATDSNSNPYTKVTVDDDSVVKDGHGTHTGPIWNPTLKAQKTQWGDIIPAFDYYNDKGELKHFAGINTPEGNSILAADCTLQIAIPAKPVPTSPTCSAGGSLTLVDGDNYSWSDNKQPGYVGTHTVTATADQGFVFTNGHKTVTYSVEVKGATNDCKVDLVAPTVEQPACTGPGTSSPGSITPGTSAHVTYVLNGTVVTATTPKTGYKLGTATGWQPGPGGTATYTVHFTDPGTCLVKVVPVDPQVTQPTCTGPGTSSPGSITPADTVGITYSVNGNVVTATPNQGYVLNVSAPWVLDQKAGTATYTATFTNPGSCLVTVVPVAPVVTPSVCTGPGTSTEPVITPATTAHITYTVNGNVVTATPDQGYQLATSEGWTIDAETGTATYTVELVRPDCTVTVTVVDPTVTVSQTCGVASTFTIPETTGVTYLVNGTITAAGTYSTPTSGTITAQAQQGYALSNPGLSLAFTLPATTPCPTVVTPVAPTVDPSTACAVEGSYTIPTTEGIDYLLDGTVIDAGAHPGPKSGTITARAKDGFTLASGSWSFELELAAAEACPTDVPVDIPNTGGNPSTTPNLAHTGAESGWLVGGGAAALLVGLLLVVVGRRREDTVG
jgi:LPXTG-motif cell wall-anchored protein